MISDRTTIDGIVSDEETGKLVLLIEESQPWHEIDRVHRQLAAKVKFYVRYIRSKRFRREHGRPPDETIVRLVSAEAPDDASLELFERIRYELSKHGIVFEHRIAQLEPAITETSEAQEPGTEKAAGTTESASKATPISPEEVTPEAFFPEEEFGPPEPEQVPETVGVGAAEPEQAAAGRAQATPEGDEARGQAAAADDRLGPGVPEGADFVAEAEPPEVPPGLPYAIAAALARALAAAIIWSLLAVAAGQGTSPLALVLGLVVGLSVRVRGPGRPLPSRIIAGLGTLFGCLCGAALSAAALAAVAQGSGFIGTLSILLSAPALIEAVRTFYDPLDLAFVAAAVYFGFRVAAPRTPPAPKADPATQSES